MVTAMIYVDRRTDGHGESNRLFSLCVWTFPIMYQKQQTNKLEKVRSQTQLCQILCI